ncbi:hypothetical protein LWI29_021446 [Acer saccharum]|uniref:Retrotransposon Copia-like N-terminal domain-containing protein n=1 Tax=Acer saccharum TaxID=4024 RepID=A0AA39SZB7_ACESA|nr:hypothetical protein LWI29_021446 [Acer saccharum]
MVSEREQSTTSAHETQAGNAAQLTASGNSKFFTPMKLELTVKLDHNNYLLWRQQIQAAIKGNRLSSFIDSTISAPNHKNLDGSVSETYLAWEQQDQMLLCWILSSISQELLPELVGCSTASEAWRTLEQLFTSQSRANVMQLKLQLQTLKKGGLSMTEYIMKKKSIIDALSFTGCVLTPDDKINAILGGLGPEYDSFVIPVTSMPNCYSLPEITALLLTHEVRIEQHTQVESLNVNLAMNKKGNNSQNGYGRGSGQFYNGGRIVNQGGGNLSNGGRKGRGRGRNNYNNNRPQCQICHRTGHGALRCYYRFDQSFQPQPNIQNNGGNSTMNTSQMAAMIATPETVIDPLWYPDSGATDHCTPESSNLMHKADYQGKEKIYMGNGSGPSYEEGSSSRGS